MVTMEDVVYEARERGYRVSSKIDAANNAEYSILQKNGNKFPLRYVDKSRTGGVRTHVGSLMRVFPGTAEELLDWYEGEDGYYYYNTVLKPDKEITISQEFEIDKELGNEFAGKTLEINIVVEVLQAEYQAIETVWRISFRRRII